MKQTITIHQLPPMLNGKGGLKRMHWTKYGDVRDKWMWLLRAEKPDKHPGKVKVRFTRYSTRVADPDNVSASFKVIGDGLTALKILKDDSFKVITEFTVMWKKVSKLKYQRVEIEIEDVK